MTDDDDTQVYRSELEAAVKAAIEAERERLLSTTIHSCHANCERFACVQTRKAVEAEREACAKVCENIGDYDENVDEYYSDIYATAIRARGET